MKHGIAAEADENGDNSRRRRVLSTERFSGSQFFAAFFLFRHLIVSVIGPLHPVDIAIKPLRLLLNGFAYVLPSLSALVAVPELLCLPFFICTLFYFVLFYRNAPKSITNFTSRKRH